MLSLLLVFISSTVYDLQEEREAVEEVLRKLGMHSFRSEKFFASPQTPLEVCLDKVSACDVFVGIYKNRYGFIPEENNPEKLSVTELEYNKARELNKPVIIFEFFDNSSREEKLAKFLVRVKNFTKGNFIKHYKNPDDLKYNILVSMVFGILQLVGIDQSIKNKLKVLVKEDIKYRDYLLNKYKYVNTRGFPPSNRILDIEIERFFITQKLTPLITNELELEFDEADNNRDQTYEKKIQSMEIDLFFPFSRVKDSGGYNEVDTGIEQSLEIGSVIKNDSRVMLIGPPGIGKTSLLILSLRNILINSQELFPILFSLKDFSSQQDYVTIPEYLDEQYEKRNFPKNFISTHLDQGSCVIMCDGLDEVTQVHVRKKIAAEIEDFSALYGANNCIIATSRPAGYKVSTLNGFRHYYINSLSSAQVSEFIGKWSAFIQTNSSNTTPAEWNIDKVESTIFSNPELVSLSKNPLFLTLMFLLISNGVVPSRKLDLYNYYVDLLVDSWEATKGNLTYAKSDLLDFIKELAFWLFKNGRTTLTRYEISTVFRIKDADINPQEIDQRIRLLTERTGLLLEHDNHFSFLHNSILEFFIGMKISDSKTEEAYSILFQDNDFIRFTELLPIVSFFFAAKSVDQINVFIEFVLNQSYKFENITHLVLLRIIESILYIPLKDDLTKKIFSQVNTLLLDDPKYLERFFPVIAKLLSTINKKNLVPLLYRLSDSNPTTVLDILKYYQGDLSEFSDLFEKCYEQASLLNVDRLIGFFKERLSVKDKFCIGLCKKFLTDKRFDINIVVNVTLNEEIFSDIIQSTARVIPEMIKEFKEKELRKSERERRRRERERRLYSQMFSKIPLTYGSIFSTDTSFSVIQSYEELQERMQEMSSVDFKQMLQVIKMLLFTKENLYLLDKKFIFNSKRTLLIQLFLLSIENQGSEQSLIDMLKNKDFSLRSDLVKLFVIKDKNLEAIDNILKRDNYLRCIYTSYLKLIDSFNKIQLYYSLIKLICEFHTLSFASNQIIKLYANRLPTNPLDSILESLIRNYRNQGHSDNLLDLVVHHARNGEVTMIGPVSRRPDESEPLTKEQEQYFNLIDCACELDPRLEERIEVLEDFNANAFNELKETIMDASNSKQLRLMASKIYAEKNSTPNSLKFFESLYEDNSVNFDICRLLIRNKYMNLTEDIILNNNYLTMVQKKILLYEFAMA